MNKLMRLIMIVVVALVVGLVSTQSAAVMADGPAKFKITTKTGNKAFAGTDAHIKINFHFKYPNQGHTYLWYLDNPGHNDFQRGNTDTFYISGDDVNPGFWAATMDHISIDMLATGIAPDWYVDWIKVEQLQTGKSWTFPIYAWMGECHDYAVSAYPNVKPACE